MIRWYERRRGWQHEAFRSVRCWGYRRRVEKGLFQQAYRVELDPNQAQRVLLAKSVGASRFVYNWGLAESQRQYELTGRRPREGRGPKSGLPRFKCKGERDSARLYEVELRERRIRLPMIGWVRLEEIRSERGFEGRILSATVRRRADRWFVSPAVERQREVVESMLVAKPWDIVGVVNIRAYGLNQLGIVPLPEGLREVTPVERKARVSAPVEAKPASPKQEASGTRSAVWANTQRREVRPPVWPQVGPEHPKPHPRIERR
jgi:Helix-turn-helix domain